MTQIVVFIKAGTSSWTTPPDFGSLVSIEALGAGGNGANAIAQSVVGAGGSSGAYSFISNVAGIRAGTVYNCSVGAGGSQTDTIFSLSGTTLVSAGAAQNSNGTTVGSAGSSGVGTLTVTGTTNSLVPSGETNAGQGGAGAPGLYLGSIKAGGSGGRSSGTATYGGAGGGGGAMGVTAGGQGSTANTGTGGTGGNGPLNTGGGIGAVFGGSTHAAANGTTSTGGGGGGGALLYGGANGAQYDNWTQTSNGEKAGPGGGGGGGGGNAGNGQGYPGGNGGGYGSGGGGGGSYAGTGTVLGAGGAGAPGLIVVTYTQATVSVTDTSNGAASLGFTGQAGSVSAGSVIDQFGPLNSDSTFQNWTAGLPTNTTATAITITQQNTNLFYGTSALQLSSTSAQTTSYLTLNSTDFQYWQDLTNIVVEWKVTLNSGDFDQAGFAYSQYYDGLQSPQPVKNGIIHLYNQHPFPTVGQTYTGSQLMSLTAANSPTGPVTTVFGNIFGNASYLNGIGPSTKNFTVHRLAIRPATPAEVIAGAGSNTSVYTMNFSGLAGLPITVSTTATGGVGVLTFSGHAGSAFANTTVSSAGAASIAFTGLTGGLLDAGVNVTGGAGSLVFTGLQGGSVASSGFTVNGGLGTLTFSGLTGSTSAQGNFSTTSAGPSALTLLGLQGSLANLADVAVTSSGPAILTLTTYAGSSNSPTVTVGLGTMSFTGLTGRTGIINGGNGNGFVFYASGNITLVNPSITRQ